MTTQATSARDPSRVARDAFRPLDTLAKRAVLGKLTQLHGGQLVLVDGGERHRFGTVSEDLAESIEHPQRRLQRALRVIFLSGRRAEDRDDGIADELLDRSPAEGDLGIHRVVKPLQEISRVLRIELGAERGRAHKISEQNRRELPLHARG